MSALNAFKGGRRQHERELAKQVGALMRAQCKFLTEFGGSK